MWIATSLSNSWVNASVWILAIQIDSNLICIVFIVWMALNSSFISALYSTFTLINLYVAKWHWRRQLHCTPPWENIHCNKSHIMYHILHGGYVLVMYVHGVIWCFILYVILPQRYSYLHWHSQCQVFKILLSKLKIYYLVIFSTS